MRVELKKLQEKAGITTVYVTHDQEEALTMADRLIVMEGGRMLQIGSPKELYNSPGTAFVATFLGETSSFRGTVESDVEGVAPQASPHFERQMTPKISRHARCSMSICANFSINGRSRCSGQFGMCS